MMDKEKILAVINTLKGLFAEKSELVGFDDWDKLIGCIITLENLARGDQDG